MTIQTGQKLPDATFIVMTEDGPDKRSTQEVFGGRKVLLFAVPGAFTPKCHVNHMPAYVKNRDAFGALGVDAIACTSANDIFVLTAWGKESGAEGIEFLADGAAEFMRAAGLDIDMSGFGMGTRSKRYAMLVDDGVVKALEIENAPGEVDASSAEHMLEVVKAA